MICMPPSPSPISFFPIALDLHPKHFKSLKLFLFDPATAPLALDSYPKEETKLTGPIYSVSSIVLVYVCVFEYHIRKVTSYTLVLYRKYNYNLICMIEFSVGGFRERDGRQKSFTSCFNSRWTCSSSATELEAELISYKKETNIFDRLHLQDEQKV